MEIAAKGKLKEKLRVASDGRDASGGCIGNIDKLVTRDHLHNTIKCITITKGTEQIYL